MPDPMTDDIAKLAAGLSPAQRRALVNMSADWQFAGKATFNANGAWSLHWAKGVGGRGALAEMESRKDGRWSRKGYRLTPLGLALRAHLEGASHGQA